MKILSRLLLNMMSCWNHGISRFRNFREDRFSGKKPFNNERLKVDLIL